ncbi:restriction endonuclease subunit S [Aneurinibacillus thermoaerophilus]|uniref:Restriction endonuclease subunit S n=1 Tax=Aneurinibacillus thermoaerophilus TaxID=143495 RepID=A0ABX8YBG2_ANETH|nr:restriction endonuclease subunit S [Aneurinibacillus thermoaerophilus]QYY42776.1 restriction endonuclease subunit S [Aneurinibacillus thermoaerophilus]
MTSNDWKEVQLKDVILFNPRESIKKGTMAKKISMDKLAPYQKKITGFEYAEFKSGTKFKNGDTLLARITPCLENGKTAQVDILDDNEIGFGSTEFIVMREISGISDNDFIYYLAISDDFRNIAIKSMTGTSGRQRVQMDVLEQTKLLIPPLREQKAIANILSTLDEKIETNNQINEKLEEMAQALFKHWFVDFKFPNENGEPYKSSGGEMVDSELGMIPKGWKIVTLEDLTSKFTTGLNPRKNFVLGKGENYYVTIKNMGNNQIYLDDKCDKIDNDAIKKINKRSDLKKGDLLFSGIGTIGRVYLIDETPENWNISESIFTLRSSKLITSEILYLLLLSEQLQGYAQQLASGSVQKGVRMRDLKAYKLAIPSNCLIEKFTELIRPLIRKNKYLEKENKRLKAIRDTLLPKLMSGEIRVPLDDEVLSGQS